MVDVAFIIPAYNEAKYISQTIRSIHTNIDSKYTYEVIVIDHGSTDETITLAKSVGATVLKKCEAVTISELRNYGVSQSEGKFLVFIDADTTLTHEWKESFPPACDELMSTKLLIGSKLDIPEKAHWISRLWFRVPKNEYQPSHLGTGLMILTRELFNEIGGFPIEQETGEDYEFCVRAKKIGAIIIARPALRGIHHGVPAGIRQFFLREIWHGRGDWLNLQTVVRSKVALVTIIFFLLHLILLVDFIFSLTGFRLASLSLFTIFALCFASSLRKYGDQNIVIIIANSAVFYLYYWARTLSFLSAMWRKSVKKRQRI